MKNKTGRTLTGGGFAARHQLRVVWILFETVLEFSAQGNVLGRSFAHESGERCLEIPSAYTSVLGSTLELGKCEYHVIVNTRLGRKVLLILNAVDEQTHSDFPHAGGLAAAHVAGGVVHDSGGEAVQVRAVHVVHQVTTPLRVTAQDLIVSLAEVDHTHLSAKWCVSLVVEQSNFRHCKSLSRIKATQRETKV